MSESAAASRIVPDVDQSLDAQRLRQPVKPRLWPLWLLILALMVAIAALAAGFWLEREQLRSELERVGGEISNMHARLDSGDNAVQDKITLVQAQVSTLFQEQEQLAMRFNATREELMSMIPASEDRVSAEAIDTLLEQIEAQQQTASMRDARLSALSASLDSLEDTAKTQHAALDDDVARLEKSVDRRADRDTAANEKRYAALSQTLEALARKNAKLDDDLRQLRQAQLALSAQLEMLR
ncbi:hypothetical protein [Vreelandella jeotgali]|uniref:hypothetical protein n=1 Tax=Vreelandella jeotgali TaxID=553386 RepID=UPI00034DE9FF|nr:hypothetical protein [Halomonas jeotgali]